MCHGTCITQTHSEDDDDEDNDDDDNKIVMLITYILGEAQPFKRNRGDNRGKLTSHACPQVG